MSFTINEAVAEYNKIVEDRASSKIDDPGVRERIAELNLKCQNNGVIFSASADAVISGVKGEELESEDSYADDDSWGGDDWESFTF